MEGQEEPHPIQVDKLKNLRKLSSVRFDQWMKFDNLRQLSCLEKLKLEGKFGIHGVDLSNSISELHILKSLYLKVSAGSTIPPLVMNTWNGLSKLDIKGHMPELPEASQFPPILKKLTLEGTMLDHDPMPILEQLPELSTLRLRADSYIGHEMKVSKRRFAQLNVLQISGLTKLRKLKIKTPSMKRLKELEFYEESQIPKIRKLKKLVEVDIIGYTPLSSHIIREEIAFLQKGDWKYTSRCLMSSPSLLPLTFELITMISI